MSLDADAIVDRRRMRRKLTFWRVSALVIALLAIVGASLLFVPAQPADAAGRLYRPHQDPGPDPRQSGSRRGARAAADVRARAP